MEAVGGMSLLTTSLLSERWLPRMGLSGRGLAR